MLESMQSLLLFISSCVAGQDNMEREVESYLRRKYETSIRDIEVVHKEDLDLVRHTSKSISTS